MHIDFQKRLVDYLSRFVSFRPLNIPTEWAQREDFLYLTFKHTAVNDGKVEFQKKKIIFTGTNGKDTYETTIDLFDEIKTEGVIYNSLFLLYFMLLS